jgi:hypothetical protein
VSDPYRQTGGAREEILSVQIWHGAITLAGGPTGQNALDQATTIWNERLGRGGRIKHLAQTGRDPTVITVVIEYPS